MRKETKMWKCRDGRKIRICDMDDNHLLNAIKMIERLARREISYCLSVAYDLEATLQGEVALDEIAREIRRLEYEGVSPEEVCSSYENLVREKKRRGL